MPQDFYDLDLLNPYDLQGEAVLEDRLVGVVVAYPMRVTQMLYSTINMGQGDNRTIRVFVKDSNNSVVDLTGATGVLYVRTAERGGSPVFNRSTGVAGEGQIGAANKGEMFFYLIPANTESLTATQYFYRVRVTLSNGKVYRVLEGPLNLM